MPKLSVFNNVSLDGCFTDGQGDMSWAHKNDQEWLDFTRTNARGGGTMLFGRVTYDLMVQFWPTPMAMQSMPAVAERMNNLPKVVFSRTLDKATWNNTRVVKDDLVGEVRRLKNEPGDDMVIMGSGTIISQLTEAKLIDEYKIVVVPVILGSGRTMFEGVSGRPTLKCTLSRTFENGNVYLCYETAL
ncbi:dihydrofolate reductase family protein [Bradyrhizobium genosp. A]|uniref:dihydrofolate reductase family protein n=1 Tax=Bradyrhizobium genosp. A TaxID=83626 RepID=UPI003CE86C99